MRKILCVVLAVTFLSTSSAFAFSFGLNYDAKTGDKELDVTLGRLNTEAKVDPNGFVSDMSVSYNVPKTTISSWLNVYKMKFADVYMTLKIGSLARISFDTVANEWKKNKGKGWGVIAKNLGIKPGSSAFHALKDNASFTLGKVKTNNGKAKIKNNSENKGKGKNK